MAFMPCPKAIKGRSIGFKKPKSKSEGRVRKNEEVRKEKKVRGMLLQPASSQPGLERGTVVLQENSITVRIIGEHKRMKVITQQLSVPNCMEIGTRTEDHKQCPAKNTPDHD
ncbi:hypothetical protein TNCV_953771 [Trichonephila clavipes]|nr:hypothetical protein TNCV_953771 [Trichonephila clavipes]